jgi:hypothetical protein
MDISGELPSLSLIHHLGFPDVETYVGYVVLVRRILLACVCIEPILIGLVLLVKRRGDMNEINTLKALGFLIWLILVVLWLSVCSNSTGYQLQG